MPELHVLAGPNGSGKSTFTREVLSGERTIDYAIPPVINPDVIALRLSPNNPDSVTIAAGREAIREREAAISRNASFAIETTLSGHTELDLIRKAAESGYLVTMTFVSVSSAAVSALRVTERAREENRTVPLDVIVRRFPRSLANLGVVARTLDRVDVYDNSERLIKVARLERGRIISVCDNVPAWAQGALREPLEVRRDREAVTQEAIARLDSRRTGVLAQKAREDDLSDRSRVVGNVLIAGEKHVAVATGGRFFVVLEQRMLARRVSVNEKVQIDLRDGHGFVRDVKDRGQERDR